MQELVENLGRVLDATLFELAGTRVTAATLAVAILTLVVSRVISHLLQRLVERGVRRRGLEPDGTVASMQRLIHYAVMFLGTGVALDTMGVNLAALFAAGAIFAVGLGFAMQNIAQNFVSGVILLVERAIKPGDVIEVDEQVVRIVHMGIRSTLVRSRDDAELIVPNALLVQSTVKNFTSRDSVYRLRCKVGVVYGADLDRVIAALQAAARDFAPRVLDKEPRVLLEGFGASSVDFDVSVWIDDPWRAPVLRSQLHLAVWWALKAAAVPIAFPQLDLHLDPVVERALQARQDAAPASA